MINPMSLQNKKIIITGASSGIGRATAIYCSELGAQIVLIARNKKRLEETLCNMAGDNHIILDQDLNEEDDFDFMFENIVSDKKKLDGFVHCAGIPCIMPLRNLSHKKLHEVMSINFYSFVDLVRSFIKKKYSNENASVVGISSAIVKHPRLYEMGYIASKAAIEAVIPVMAMECKKRKIRVNCIEPGNVYTEMIRHVINENGNEEILDKFAANAIFGWQKPEDIAKVCAFILSDEAGAITARVIQADGGYK